MLEYWIDAECLGCRAQYWDWRPREESVGPLIQAVVPRYSEPARDHELVHYDDMHWWYDSLQCPDCRGARPTQYVFKVVLPWYTNDDMIDSK
jgi:hypothetical protein